MARRSSDRISVRRHELTLLALLAVGMSSGALGASQGAAQPSQAAHAAAVQSVKKLTLDEVTRISTEEAARAAAQTAGRSDAAQGATDAGKLSRPSTSGAVLEFRPREFEATRRRFLASQGKGSAPLKRVHGMLDGAVHARELGTHREVGSAGATSKAGKTAVDIEIDHSQVAPPARR